MMILYWSIAILTVIVYIYVPSVCLYGIVRLYNEDTPSDIICNPFFGLKKVSQRTGFIAWGIQCLYLGVILSDLVSNYLHGTHPFFFDWFTVFA
ncbi:MAG: hypothetical protein K2K75_09565 [Muribaculaceae bacterium]|nr:hypothetical protein [Muribaculaceae bacterium]